MLLGAMWLTAGIAPALAWERDIVIPSYHDAAPDAGRHFLPVAWTLPVLFLLFIYRRPAARTTDSRATDAASKAVISLSCSRCGRVLELPRDKANRPLFCPRCGSTLPRRA
jgi:DNA-directed RNA polymerase subunit RPC12/RpoP